MGDTTETIRKSKEPVYSKGSMKPVEERRKQNCINCNSTNTICVYSDKSGSNIGAYYDIEYYCNDCHYYTIYEFEYDS